MIHSLYGHITWSRQFFANISPAEHFNPMSWEVIRNQRSKINWWESVSTVRRPSRKILKVDCRVIGDLARSVAFCPIFGFWRWNFQDRHFTGLTEFLARNQLVSQLVIDLIWHDWGSGTWKFDFGRRKHTAENLKRKFIFSKLCPIFKYENLWTQIWQIGWNFCPETNYSVNWWWYETKLGYWKSKSRRKLKNYVVPWPIF